MCYGMGCPREDWNGTCNHPNNCLLEQLAREAESEWEWHNYKLAQLDRHEHFCPNCDGECEISILTRDEDGDFYCDECGELFTGQQLVDAYTEKLRVEKRSIFMIAQLNQLTQDMCEVRHDSQ